MDAFIKYPHDGNSFFGVLVRFSDAKKRAEAVPCLAFVFKSNGYANALAVCRVFCIKADTDHRALKGRSLCGPSLEGFLQGCFTDLTLPPKWGEPPHLRGLSPT